MILSGCKRSPFCTQVLVSLAAFEKPAHVVKIVQNVFQYAREDTLLALHLSTNADRAFMGLSCSLSHRTVDRRSWSVNESWAINSVTQETHGALSTLANMHRHRFMLTPQRTYVQSNTKTIIKAHALNVVHALKWSRDAFRYVVLMASNSWFFRTGMEEWVHQRMLREQNPPLSRPCQYDTPPPSVKNDCTYTLAD